eukprot:7961662-Pyramimonas_sp.AAC.1
MHTLQLQADSEAAKTAALEERRAAIKAAGHRPSSQASVLAKAKAAMQAVNAAKAKPDAKVAMAAKQTEPPKAASGARLITQQTIHHGLGSEPREPDRAYTFL